MLKTILAAAITATAVLGVNAQAAPAFYLVGTVGATTADHDCLGGTNCDTSGGGWKLLGGLKLAPDVALEVQRHDFGSVSFYDPAYGTYVMKNSGIGFGVAVTSTPKPGVDLFFRLGLASNKSKSQLSALGLATEDAAIKPYFGMGVAFQVSQRIALRLEVDGTTFKPLDDNMSATMLSGGLQFSF